jgi:AsmA protein
VRATRWILIGLGAVAAMVVAGLWLLTALVDAGRFRPQIQAAVQSATGRALQIDGDVSLDLFPWLAISVSDAALANPPGFSTPELVRWRELSLGARLRPLLQGELELSRIRLTGAQLVLERRADGVANWQGLGEGATPAAEAEQRRTVLRSLAGIELRESSVTYIDQAAGTNVALSDLAVTLPRWAPGEPLPVQASGGIAVGTRPVWPFAVSTTLTFREGSTALADLSLALTLKTQPAAKGLVTSWKTRSVELIHEPLVVRGAPLAVKFGAGDDGLSIRDWRYVAGNEQSAAAAAVQLQLASLRRGLIDAGITPPYTTDPEVLGPLRLATTLRLADGLWQLEPLELTLDATTLRGRVARDATGVVEVTLAGDQMALGRYLEPDDAPTPPFVFPTAALRALEARATVTLERATLGEAELEGVTLRLVHDAAGLRRAPP